MTRVGLVLGAGGVVGQAYHSGVLVALEETLGWDPRTAEVVVGTSAGSITGTLLRHGVPARDLAAWALKAPLSAEGEALERFFGTDQVEFEPFRPGEIVKRKPSLPTRHMVRRAVVRPWHFRPMSAALALLGPGVTDVADQVSLIRHIEGAPWPAEQLWICAVRRSDGRRMVFGRPGTIDVPWHLAIAASCAVPGYFAPVHIDDHAYVDGGAHSPTNAAVLRTLGLDTVIVVSPMSGPSGGPVKTVYEATRWHAARRAAREAAALRAAGVRVLVVRPGEEEQEVMGDDFMAGAKVADVVRVSSQATRALLQRSENHALAGSLSTV
jgi:NTE family protein